MPTSAVREGTCPRIPVQPHDQLRLGLLSAGRDLVAAGDDRSFAAARDRLVDFCVQELLTHLVHDESWLSQAADCEAGRLLALAMRAEARAMQATVLDLATIDNACDAVALTKVLHTLLAAHVSHQTLLHEARVS